jgi:hypothetical protein
MQANHYELWGYPGAGKSTIAYRLASEVGIEVPPLQRLGKGTAAWIRRRLWQLRDPALWSAYLPPDSLVKRQMRRFNHVRHRQSLTLKECIGPCVLEEGELHELWRLLYWYPDQLSHKWWEKFVDRPGPVVLLLDLPLELARERIGTKLKPGPINRELLACASGERWLRAQAAFEAVHRTLVNSRLRRVIPFDAGRYHSSEISTEIGKVVNGANSAAETIEVGAAESRSKASRH